MLSKVPCALRRRKLHISRPAETAGLDHSAAPPHPKKSWDFSGAPLGVRPLRRPLLHSSPGRWLKCSMAAEMRSSEHPRRPWQRKGWGYFLCRSKEASADSSLGTGGAKGISVTMVTVVTVLLVVANLPSPSSQPSRRTQLYASPGVCAAALIMNTVFIFEPPCLYIQMLGQLVGLYSEP